MIQKKCLMKIINLNGIYNNLKNYKLFINKIHENKLKKIKK